MALVIALPTLLLFGFWQRISAAWCGAATPAWGAAGPVSSPAWYLLEIWKEGQPFIDSFFGYHNLQRYTEVVNNHAGPWWYYAPLLVLVSLPFTPLLLLAMANQGRIAGGGLRPQASLSRFALAAGGGAVFFSISATKLPSYLLPALPAMGLLIALADARALWLARARWACVALAAAMAAAFLPVQLVCPLIQDPEIPDLARPCSVPGGVDQRWFVCPGRPGWWPAAAAPQRPLQGPGCWRCGCRWCSGRCFALVPTGEIVDQRRAAARAAAGCGGAAGASAR